MLLSSDINSLEIGHITETRKEYEEILEFYNRYIKKYHKEKETVLINKSSKKTNVLKPEIFWSDLERYISDRIGWIKLRVDNQSIHIKTNRNNYEIYFYFSNGNRLRMNGIISGKEMEFIDKNHEKYFINNKMMYELFDGGDKYYPLVWGELKEAIASKNIDEVYEDEKLLIIEAICDFIQMVESVKSDFFGRF